MVYIDDILLAGADIAEMTTLKQFLDDQFKIKDGGWSTIFWASKSLLTLMVMSCINTSILQIY